MKTISKGTETEIYINGTGLIPQKSMQLIFDKGGKNMQYRKESLFNKWCGKTGQLHVKQ